MILQGIDPLRVDDSAEFALGTRGFAYNGAEYQYLEADGTIAASDAVIVHSDCGAEALTATLAADSAGVGKPVAVSPPSTRSQAITVGKFFWGCVYAPGPVGVTVNVLISANAGRLLCCTATAGKLDDTLDLDATVPGVIIQTDEPGTGTAAIAAVINYPVIGDITQT